MFIIGPKLLFHKYGLASQPSPKLIFHIWICPKTHLSPYLWSKLSMCSLASTLVSYIELQREPPENCHLWTKNNVFYTILHTTVNLKKSAQYFVGFLKREREIKIPFKKNIFLSLMSLIFHWMRSYKNASFYPTPLLCNRLRDQFVNFSTLTFVFRHQLASI